MDRAQFARNVELVVEAARTRIAGPTSHIEDATGAERLFTHLETDLLDRLIAGDLDGVSGLLTEDFTITTAGWLSGPVDAGTWLGGLDAQHRLGGYELRSIDVRRPLGSHVAVVLLHSTQYGTRNRNPWVMEFWYTDVWVHRPTAWRLAVRHASGRPLDM